VKAWDARKNLFPLPLPLQAGKLRLLHRWREDVPRPHRLSEVPLTGHHPRRLEQKYLYEGHPALFVLVEMVRIHQLP
jgi:hypothetical protein